MKMIVAFAALVAVALAAPAQQDIVVVQENLHDNIGVDGYRYNYELSDGQSVEQTAELKNIEGAETPVLVISGSYTWVDPASGQRYTITYTADENGFHPSGDHIPV